MKSNYLLLLAFLCLWVSKCSRDTASIELAADSITEQDLIKHITILSSDEFEGRAPSSRGEEKTIRYLKEQFQQLGLEPGNSTVIFRRCH